MKRRVRTDVNARDAMIRKFRDRIAEDRPGELMKGYYRRELERLEAGPYVCRHWELPEECRVPGPHAGGLSEDVRIELDGTLTWVEPVRWFGVRELPDGRRLGPASHITGWTAIAAV